MYGAKPFNFGAIIWPTTINTENTSQGTVQHKVSANEDYDIAVGGALSDLSIESATSQFDSMSVTNSPELRSRSPKFDYRDLLGPTNLVKADEPDNQVCVEIYEQIMPFLKRDPAIEIDFHSSIHDLLDNLADDTELATEQIQAYLGMFRQPSASIDENRLAALTHILVDPNVGLSIHRQEALRAWVIICLGEIVDAEKRVQVTSPEIQPNLEPQSLDVVVQSTPTPISQNRFLLKSTILKLVFGTDTPIQVADRKDKRNFEGVDTTRLVAPETEINLPSKVEKYKGASGSVKALDQDRVVKVYKIKDVDGLKAIDQAICEYLILDALDGTGVVRTHGLFAAPNKEGHLSVYHIQDNIPGKNAQAYVKTMPEHLKTRFTHIFALKALRQLQIVHGRHVSHNDPHLGNFQITPEGEVWLVDFEHSVHSDIAETQRGGSGMRSHLAPEQCRDALNNVSLRPSVKVDVFMFGTSLYQIRHNLEVPVNANPIPNDPVANKKSYLKNKAEYVRPEPPEPGSIDELIWLCLDPNPETRPNVAELLEHPAMQVAQQNEALWTSEIFGK